MGGVLYEPVLSTAAKSGETIDCRCMRCTVATVVVRVRQGLASSAKGVFPASRGTITFVPDPIGRPRSSIRFSAPPSHWLMPQFREIVRRRRSFRLGGPAVPAPRLDLDNAFCFLFPSLLADSERKADVINSKLSWRWCQHTCTHYRKHPPELLMLTVL